MGDRGIKRQLHTTDPKSSIKNSEAVLSGLLELLSRKCFLSICSALSGLSAFPVVQMYHAVFRYFQNLSD